MNNPHSMRRKDRKLTTEQALQVLEQAESGCLSMALGNRPYTIPVNYVLWEGKIYIHVAKEGKKIDWIQQNPAVCFVVSHMLGVKKATTYCAYTAYYESVIVEGQARVLQQHSYKKEILSALVKKHDPQVQLPPMDAASADVVWLIEITIDSIDGKGQYPVQE